MKKSLVLISLIGLIGCKQQDIGPPPEPSNNVEARAESKAGPSASYMTGYWDGYHGKWLAPARWVALNEYREGWSQGSYDRKNNIHRYDPPKATSQEDILIY